MTTSYPFDWVDAFTDTAFGGNGCAVVHDEGALPAETCLAYTKETGLVECTFIGPSEVADLKVRYFLASHEIPFAGHPTVASVISAVSRGRVSGPKMTLETGAGIINIEISAEGWVTMTQNAPLIGAEIDKGLVANVVGLAPDDILDTPQIVSTGLPFVVTLLRDHDALRRATLDVAALDVFREEAKLDGAPVMEPYLVALGGATPQGDTFARLLLPPPNPAEDPFTGSATGCAASYLWARGHLTTSEYIAEQGHWMGRPGQARVEVLGPPEGITGVRVAGQGRIVMSGQMHP